MDTEPSDFDLRISKILKQQEDMLNNHVQHIETMVKDTESESTEFTQRLHRTRRLATYTLIVLLIILFGLHGGIIYMTQRMVSDFHQVTVEIQTIIYQMRNDIKDLNNTTEKNIQDLNNKRLQE